MREAVSEKEQPDSARNHRKPGASGLAGNESLPKVEGEANPEKLAGDKHHEEEAENHSDGWELPVVDDRVGTKSKDRQRNDRTPMDEDTLINGDETDHPSPAPIE